MGSVDESKHAREAPKCSSTIPIIDFGNWHTTPDHCTRLGVANEIITALRTVGFVYLTNHNLPQHLVDAAFAHSKRLFSLSHADKMLAPHPDGSAVHRGYSYPGLEKVSQYAGGDEAEGEKLREVRDCKESFEIGSEGNEEQPNLWVPEEVLPGFREFTQMFYWECHKLAQEILSAIALGLGLEDPDAFLNLHSGLNSQLRLLHYPPIAASELELGAAARMPAHSDWSSITMLFQDDCGGLEVESSDAPGDFVPATPIPRAVVVNVGDLLMRWSNGPCSPSHRGGCRRSDDASDYLKSTLHRVTLPPLSDRFEGVERMTRERWSIPYFVAPDPDALVECLPTCVNADTPVKYEPVTQREYGRMRAKVQYPSVQDAVAA